MEILIPIIIVLIFVGYLGYRIAKAHSGHINSILPKRKTKEEKKWDFRHSRMKVHPHDWSNPGKVLQEYTELFDNKLERYARFLELRLRFDDYDNKTDEEQEAMANSAAPTTVTPNEQSGNSVVLGDCRFLCGTAPCSCEQDYQLFETLKPEFSNQPNHYPVYNVSLIDVLFEMKN